MKNILERFHAKTAPHTDASASNGADNLQGPNTINQLLATQSPGLDDLGLVTTPGQPHTPIQAPKTPPKKSRSKKSKKSPVAQSAEVMGDSDGMVMMNSSVTTGMMPGVGLPGDGGNNQTILSAQFPALLSSQVWVGLRFITFKY